jgi:hypothetical protein
MLSLSTTMAAAKTGDETPSTSSLQLAHSAVRDAFSALEAESSTLFQTTSTHQDASEWATLFLDFANLGCLFATTTQTNTTCSCPAEVHQHQQLSDSLFRVPLLQVDTPLDLVELIDSQFDAEVLEGGNAYKCGGLPTGQLQTRSIKSTKAVTWPKLLGISLGRFREDTTGRRSRQKRFTKVTTRVKVPQSFQRTNTAGVATYYSLQSAVFHKGKELKSPGAHYISVKPVADGKWDLYNDSHITRSADMPQEFHACLLFYAQVSS